MNGDNACNNWIVSYNQPCHRYIAIQLAFAVRETDALDEKREELEQLIESLTTIVVPQTRALITPRINAFYPRVRELLYVTGRSIKICKFVQPKLKTLPGPELDKAMNLLKKGHERCAEECEHLKKWVSQHME